MASSNGRRPAGGRRAKLPSCFAAQTSSGGGRRRMARRRAAHERDQDFAVGMAFRHRRGRTLSQEENARWSLQTMNTAQSHWNIESMKTYLDGRFETPIVNAAIVIALA